MLTFVFLTFFIIGTRRNIRFDLVPMGDRRPFVQVSDPAFKEFVCLIDICIMEIARVVSRSCYILLILLVIHRGVTNLAMIFSWFWEFSLTFVTELLRIITLLEMNLIEARGFSLLLLLGYRRLLFCDAKLNNTRWRHISRSSEGCFWIFDVILLETITIRRNTYCILTQSLEWLPLIVALLFLVHAFCSFAVLFNQHILILLSLDFTIR